MEIFSDFNLWLGLLTLVIIEIVLGIDNLVFIAILSEKLPPDQRDKARLIGLLLALVMRLILLSAMFWLVTLTEPIVTLGKFVFSGRDLILIVGGLFLLIKATSELHERMEGTPHTINGQKVYAGFGIVITQIVVLDMIFSLDAVITAVGMVEQLWVMMTAVIIAIGLMMLAAKPLTKFVNAHPTVVVLCLSFLLMVGLSLVAEGLGLHIPKGYLYAAIGFSILTEFFNQLASRNLIKNHLHMPKRERIAGAIQRLLGGKYQNEIIEEEMILSVLTEDPAFSPEERSMVSEVLTLAERPISSIMTPRAMVTWADLAENSTTLSEMLFESSHSYIPVGEGSLDKIIGIARVEDLMRDLVTLNRIDLQNSVRNAVIVPDFLSILKVIEVFKRSRVKMLLVVNEYGTLGGVVTPIDILEAIAGDFSEEHEKIVSFAVTSSSLEPVK